MSAADSSENRTYKGSRNTQRTSCSATAGDVTIKGGELRRAKASMVVSLRFSRSSSPPNGAAEVASPKYWVFGFRSATPSLTARQMWKAAVLLTSMGLRSSVNCMGQRVSNPSKKRCSAAATTDCEQNASAWLRACTITWWRVCSLMAVKAAKARARAPRTGRPQEEACG